VFAVLEEPLDRLLQRRFASFRTTCLPNVVQLTEAGFELLPTGLRPHLTVRLWRADDLELGQLMAALGSPQPKYAGSAIWREEG
jgi:hypothetical protein